MRLYSLCTPSHEILKREWFLSTLQDDFELVIEEGEQDCPAGRYKSAGWAKTMEQKVDLILGAIRENWGEIFVYSDIDVQFFRPYEGTIIELMKDRDLLIQRDSPQGSLCAGFFVCRANEKNLNLWNDVKQLLPQSDSRDDQDLLNEFLLRRASILSRVKTRVVRSLERQTYLSNPYHIQWAYLPIDFFGGGTLTGRLWKPGVPLEIPRNIILHHANWTVGVPNKIAQLQFVRDTVAVYKRSDLNS